MKYQIPKINYDDEVKIDLEKVEEIIDDINKRRDKGINQQLLNELRSRLKIKHVYHSNAIEGNNLTLRETEMILNGMVVNERPLKDEIEAKSLNNATEYLYSLIEGSEALTKRTLLELHGLIIDKSIDQQSGKFRKNDVQIKGSNHSPPNHFKVEEHVDNLFKWMNRNSHKYKPIEMASILHHWLTWIHPFNDGNGRVSRLFLNFFLLQKGYPEVVIRISDRDDYYNSLINADNGEIIDLIKILVVNVLESAKQYEELFNEDDRQKQWKEKLKDVAADQYEKIKKQHSYDYEIWKNNIQNFQQLIGKNLLVINEQLPNINFSVKEYEILTLNQYLDLIEDRKVSNTWYFNFRLFNDANGKMVNLLFFFERYRRSVPLELLGVQIKDKEGKIKRKNKGYPLIKLFITTRTEGKSEGLIPEITLRNVGTFKEHLSFGVVKNRVTNPDGSKRIKQITNVTDKPSSIVRTFFDEVIQNYLFD